MENILEIRWHGRGGQGAKTAAMLLAQAAMESGFEIQAFPEYGPERSGAPIKAYTRISKDPILIHSGITAPDIVVVLDPSLADVVDIAEGLDDGILLVNSSHDPKQLGKKLKFNSGKMATVDADAIAREETGTPIANMPMLGALIKLEQIVSMEELEKSIKEKLSARIGEEKTALNIKGVKRAFEEVRIQ